MSGGYPIPQDRHAGHDAGRVRGARRRAAVPPHKRRHATFLTIAGLAVAGIVLLGLALFWSAPTPPPGLQLVDGTLRVPAAVEAHVDTPDPVGTSEIPNGEGPRLVIPEAGIDAPIDGTLTLSGRGWIPPDHSLGWSPGSAPAWADQGSTLLAGHVWVGQTPGVLQTLHTVIPGNVVTVVDDDQRAEFLVTTVAEFPRDELPSWVWGSVDGPRRMVLVTCAGEATTNSDGHRVWSKNLVVVAVPTVGTELQTKGK